MDKVIHSLYKRAQGDWHKNKAKTLAKSRCRGLSKNEVEITPYVTSPFLKFQVSKIFSCGPPFAKLPKMSDSFMFRKSAATLRTQRSFWN